MPILAASGTSAMSPEFRAMDMETSFGMQDSEMNLYPALAQAGNVGDSYLGPPPGLTGRQAIKAEATSSHSLDVSSGLARGNR